MAKLVLLDAGPLGYLTHPDPPERGQQCVDWATDLRRKGAVINVPASADYEVRRSYIRINSGMALAQLEALIDTFGYADLCVEDWRLAAELWAQARLHGIQTAGDNRVDFDVVLSAQARRLELAGEDVWIATDNVGHLGVLFHKARLWEEIIP